MSLSTEQIYKKFLNQCVIFKTDEFVDKRGFFTEIFNEKLIKKKINKNFKCKHINLIYYKEFINNILLNCLCLIVYYLLFIV